MNAVTFDSITLRLDCQNGGNCFVACNDDGVVLSYVGDSSIISGNCPTLISSDHPAGSGVDNVVVFTFSPPVTLQPFGTCDFMFDVKVESVSNDITPLAITGQASTAGQCFPGPTFAGACGIYTIVFPLQRTQYVMPDRTNDTIVRVKDLNSDGIISDPGEVFLFFSAANAAGTPGMANPTAQAVSVCREVLVGDQGNGLIYKLADMNHDGDAQDAGESIVFCGPGNSAGLSFAFPTGAAFDSNCIPYVVNAGNTSGPDAIYRLIDLNGDGDAMDNVGGMHEASFYVADGAFGSGNGPYGPQELFFIGSVGYVKNSSTGIFAIYRFEDLNSNGRADDPGEFNTFLDNANASGVTLAAGLQMERDMARPNSAYTLQLAAGGVDQLVRATDLNNDRDAQDVGEAAIVYTNAQAGFTATGIESLPNGDVFLTDNSGIRVFRLRDLNSDGDYLDGEATIYMTAAGTILQARQMDALPTIGDFTGDGIVGVADLLLLINGWGPGGCRPADVNCDDTVGVPDLLLLINNWG